MKRSKFDGHSCEKGLIKLLDKQKREIESLIMIQNSLNQKVKATEEMETKIKYLKS